MFWGGGIPCPIHSTHRGGEAYVDGLLHLWSGSSLFFCILFQPHLNRQGCRYLLTFSFILVKTLKTTFVGLHPELVLVRLIPNNSSGIGDGAFSIYVPKMGNGSLTSQNLVIVWGNLQIYVWFDSRSVLEWPKIQRLIRRCEVGRKMIRDLFENCDLFFVNINILTMNNDIKRKFNLFISLIYTVYIKAFS